MAEPLTAEEAATLLNSQLDGWSKVAGLHFVRVSRDEVVAELEVASRHHQAYGIVHGGVHCTVIETLASVGAALDAMAYGRRVVGLENHTSFLKAVHAGKLVATAKPLTRGRRSQVWAGDIVDAAGRLIATGRVRLLCVDPEPGVAGQKLDLKA